MSVLAWATRSWNSEVEVDLPEDCKVRGKLDGLAFSTERLSTFSLVLGEGIVPEQPCFHLSFCLATHRINFLMKSFYYTI